MMIDRWGVRADVERRGIAYAVGPIARSGQADSRRPACLIQAYYSPEVPRDFVEVKADVLGLLKEYEARSGGKIRLNLVQTELYSDEARDAEKRFGIEPRPVMVNDQGKQSTADVFLGVAFTAGVEEVVIPFFDRGLPVEYELTRSIRVVSRSGRKKVGILSTDAKMMGGFDMRSFNQTPEWSIVTELKKQYDVSSVSPDTPISQRRRCALGRAAVGTTQKQIDNLTAYVKSGGATLLFLDPFPVDNPQISPSLPRMPAGGPFGGGPPPEPKGNLRELLDLVGIEWPSVDIVWNAYNPHPKLDLQSTPEIVFIGKGSGAKDPFNPDQIASSELQEIVTLVPGAIAAQEVGRPRFHSALAHQQHGRHDHVERRRAARVHGHPGNQPSPPAHADRAILHDRGSDHRSASGRYRRR